MEAIFSLECSPESLWEALLQKVFRFRDKEFKKIITTTYQRRRLGSYNAQQLRGMHDSYLMSRHWLKDLFCCLMSEHQWNFRLIKFFLKKPKHTAKLSLMSSTVFSPSFITRLWTPSHLGRVKFRTAWWPYFIMSMNSGFFTSSKGWSHAMIQHVSSSSNFFWSHNSCKYKLIM